MIELGVCGTDRNTVSVGFSCTRLQLTRNLIADYPWLETLRSVHKGLRSSVICSAISVLMLRVILVIPGRFMGSWWYSCYLHFRSLRGLRTMKLPKFMYDSTWGYGGQLLL